MDTIHDHNKKSTAYVRLHRPSSTSITWKLEPSIKHTNGLCLDGGGKNRGSMDQVHGGGPWTKGSMFCTFPVSASFSNKSRPRSQ